MKKIINFIFCILLIIIIFISLFIVVFFSMTLAQISYYINAFYNLDIEDIKLSSDIKAGQIFKDIITFKSVKESEMIQNKFDKYTEEKYVQNNFKGSYLEEEENFSSLLINKITYSEKRELTYSDKMLAYIFDNMFNNLLNTDLNLGFLKEIKISVGEISIFTENSSTILRAVYFADIKNTTDGIESRFKKVLKYLPQRIYFENYFSMNVNEKGKAVFNPLGFTINNTENNFISSLIKSYVLKNTGFDSEYEMNLQLGKLISDVIFNLGSIGLAENNKTDNLSDLTFGISGIFNHGITVITHDNVTSKS